MERRIENAARDQLPLPLRLIVQPARNNTRDRLIPVANQHFLALAHPLDVRTELRLQVADVDGAHGFILPNMTKLVTLKPSPRSLLSMLVAWQSLSMRPLLTIQRLLPPAADP